MFIFYRLSPNTISIFLSKMSLSVLTRLYFIPLMFVVITYGCINQTWYTYNWNIMEY